MHMHTESPALPAAPWSMLAPIFSYGLVEQGGDILLLVPVGGTEHHHSVLGGWRRPESENMRDTTSLLQTQLLGLPAGPKPLRPEGCCQHPRPSWHAVLRAEAQKGL